MKKTAMWLAFVLIVVALSACTRSASSGPPTPPAAPAEESAFPTPVVNNAAATQTAAVIELAPQTGGGEEGEATPVPLETTPAASTPQPTTAVVAATPTPKPKPKPTSAPVSVATSVPSMYTLHKGEFPYCLARRFNVNPDALLAINGLSRGQWVYPGTTLTIPQGAGPFPYQRALRAHPTTYVVQPGDTFYSIACLFGDVWPEAIAAANGMNVNAALTPGQSIRIP